MDTNTTLSDVQLFWKENVSGETMTVTRAGRRRMRQTASMDGANVEVGNEFPLSAGYLPQKRFDGTLEHGLSSDSRQG